MISYNVFMLDVVLEVSVENKVEILKINFAGEQNPNNTETNANKNNNVKQITVVDGSLTDKLKYIANIGTAFCAILEIILVTTFLLQVINHWNFQQEITATISKTNSWDP